MSDEAHGTTEINPRLLGRFVAGACSADEVQVVEAWLAASPSNAQKLERWRTAWNVSELVLTQRAAREVNAERGLARVHEATVRAPVAVQSTNTRRWMWQVPMAIAAAIALICVGAYVRPNTQTAAFRDIATTAGSRTTLTLRDGTRLTLGPLSHIRVPLDYGRPSRTVELDGEAYFAVVHDARHPFAVLANNVRVTDVGTEFDVRGYDGDVRVAVARGSVVVGAGLRPARSFPYREAAAIQDIPLSVGDVAEVVNGVPTVTHGADVAALTAWRQGALVFNNVPFRDVVRELGRTFDVTVTFADTAIAQELVTGNFRGQGVDEILWELSAAMGVRCDRNGQHVIIRHGPPDIDLPKRQLSPAVRENLVQGK